MTDRLAEIFTRQREYVESLRPIYQKNGLDRGSFPWSLDGRINQEEFRLLAWRMTEEIVEAVQCFWLLIDERTFLESSASKKAFREEVADAFHFFIELCLATGVTEAELVTGIEGYEIKGDSDRLAPAFRFCGKAEKDTIPQRWWGVVYKLGEAMHLLRQRPWRTDDRRTDRGRFVAAINATFNTFITACKRSGIDADILYEEYFHKSGINEERRQAQQL